MLAKGCNSNRPFSDILVNRSSSHYYYKECVICQLISSTKSSTALSLSREILEQHSLYNTNCAMSNSVLYELIRSQNLISTNV